MKAERHPRERERLRALHSFGVLDTAPEALFDELVALARELLEVPIVLVSLVDEHRQWFKARTGFEPCETSLDESFCAHAILDDGILVVEDARTDPRFADNPLVAAPARADKAVRFYAGAPLVTEAGLPLGTLCVLDYRPREFGGRDRRRLALLRDQVMALLERRRLQAESDHRTRLKSEFLAHVSHEIRTPLAAVLGYAELLGGTLEKADDLAIVRTIVRNGGYLRSIVDELLDISRIEAGQLEIDHAPCALGQLLSDIESLMRIRALETGVEWRIECRDALPLAILTDPLRLRQILINLTGNALKFTARGEVVLTVTSHTSATATMELEFTVRDTGIGMNAEQLAHVFTPFGQAESDTAARFGGSGLGLTISRELARLLGGELHVESEPGVGSVFHLHLPCEPAGPEREVPTLADTSASRVPLAPVAATDALAGCRLLVVDDQDDMRHLAARTLERAGAEVETRDDGVRALERLRDGARVDARRFDALVLDIQLPGLDGFGVLAAIAAERIDVPVVALTADALAGQRERCIAAGCRGYVSKPFAAEELIGAVLAVLARRERPASTRAGNGHRVLIVDDSRDLTDALGRLLVRHGYEIAIANTAAIALDLAGQVPPDCILLDRQLPDMNSPELLALLRAREDLRETRFVSLSGAMMDEAERQRLGFDLYLHKPIALKALLEALGGLLGLGPMSVSPTDGSDPR